MDIIDERKIDLYNKIEKIVEYKNEIDTMQDNIARLKMQVVKGMADLGLNQFYLIGGNMLKKYKKKIKLKLLDSLTDELFNLEKEGKYDEKVGYTITYLIDKKYEVLNGTK